MILKPFDVSSYLFMFVYISIRYIHLSICLSITEANTHIELRWIMNRNIKKHMPYIKGLLKS